MRKKVGIMINNLHIASHLKGQKKLVFAPLPLIVSQQLFAS